MDYRRIVNSDPTVARQQGSMDTVERLGNVFGYQSLSSPNRWELDKTYRKRVMLPRKKPEDRGLHIFSSPITKVKTLSLYERTCIKRRMMMRVH
jgi:hypothetical protein